MRLRLRVWASRWLQCLLDPRSSIELLSVRTGVENSILAFPATSLDALLDSSTGSCIGESVCDAGFSIILSVFNMYRRLFMEYYISNAITQQANTTFNREEGDVTYSKGANLLLDGGYPKTGMLIAPSIKDFDFESIRKDVECNVFLVS